MRDGATSADQQPSESVCVEIEQKLIGYQLRGQSYAIKAVLDYFPRYGEFSAPHDRIQSAILRSHERGLAIGPASIALQLADDAGLIELKGIEYLQAMAAYAPACPEEKSFRSYLDTAALTWIWAKDHISDADRRAKADELLRSGGADAFDDAKTLLEIGTAPPVTAIPYQWVPPEEIPTRKFLFVSRHAAAGHVSITGAFGGGGKSSLIVAELLAHCTGKNLLNDAPLFQGRAWYLGLEDPIEEHRRRIAAAALLHKIAPAQLEGRLFLNDAEQDFVVARDTRDGLTIAHPVIDGIIGQIRRHGITLLAVDPFVASHNVSENDNGAIDTVARIWVRIARETGCAIDLAHHLRKSNGTNEPSDDDFRGASSLIPAVRSARLLRPMSKEEAEKMAVAEPSRFFRLVDGKKNMAPRATDAVWRELMPMSLNNGNPPDHVAAVASWRPPDASDAASLQEIEDIKTALKERDWRASPQSSEWAGHAVAKVLGLDMHDQSARAQVRSALQVWLKTGVLRTYEKQDVRRKTREFIGVPEK